MARWLETTGLMVAFGLVAAAGPAPAMAQDVTRERDVKITGPRGQTIDRQFKSTLTPGGLQRQTTITRPGGTFTRDVNVSRSVPPVAGPPRGGGWGPPPMRGWGPPGRPVFVGPGFGGVSTGAAVGIGALGAALGTGAGFLLGRATAPPPGPVIVGQPVIVAGAPGVVAGPPPIIAGTPGVVNGPGTVYTQAPVVLPPPSPEVTQAIGRLSSWYESTRKESCYILGRLGDPRAVPALVDILKNDKGKDVRIAAATAIGQIGDPSAAIYLERVITYDKKQEVRDAAAMALAKLPRPDPAASQTQAQAQAPTQFSARSPAPATNGAAPLQGSTSIPLEPSPENVPPPPTPVVPSPSTGR